MKPELSTAQFRFVCFHCRKMIRRPLPRSYYPAINRKPEGASCAECGNIPIFVGRYFKPPRRNDLNAWKQLILAYVQPGGYRDSTGKYRAKMPREVVRQREIEKEQRLLDGAKRQKSRLRLQKRQERLTSLSKPGRSLTSRTQTTDDRWLSSRQKL